MAQTGIVCGLNPRLQYIDFLDVARRMQTSTGRRSLHFGRNFDMRYKSTVEKAKGMSRAWQWALQFDEISDLFIHGKAPKMYAAFFKDSNRDRKHHRMAFVLHRDFYKSKTESPLPYNKWYRQEMKGRGAKHLLRVNTFWADPDEVGAHHMFNPETWKYESKIWR